METVAVKATLRETTRSKGARAVRSNGLIPAVVYGGNEVHAVAVDFIELRDAIYTPDFKVVELDLDGKSVRCIVRDVQFHPVTEDIVHVDFQQLVPGRKIKVDIPVHFSGVAPGLKQGGKLIKKLRKVTVLTVPEKLMTELILDVSELELGQSVRVRDFTVEEGIAILSDPNNPVASVEVPRLLKALEAEEAAAEEAAAEALEGEEGEEGAEGEEGEAEAGEGGDEAATDDKSGE